VRLILSGHTDAQDIIAGINEAGIWQYILKPWHPEQVGTLSRCLKGTDKGMEMKREDILTMRASALQLTVASMQMFMLTNHPIEGLAGTDAAQLAQYIDWQFPAPKSDAPKGIQENAL
jgi:two-component system response regulator HupR/HoxA